MKYIYLIICNISKKKKNIPKNKLCIYKLNRYSFLLNNGNIPLIQISNSKVNTNDLVKFYFKNYINLNLNHNPILEIKTFKKYKNIEYLFIETDNFIKTEIASSNYHWKHYIDMVEENKRMEGELDFNINKNKIIDMGDVTVKSVINWYFDCE